MAIFDQIGGFMEKLTGKGPEADLDKVKKGTQEALTKLKEGQGTADAVLTEGLKGLRKDLDELGISDATKRKEYEDKYVEAFQREMTDSKMEAISSSPEFAGLNDFVGQYATYSQLDSMIAEAKKTESSDPILRFAKQLKSTLPDWATSLIGMGIGMFAVTPEPGKAPSEFEKKLLEVAAILSGDSAKKADEKPKEEAKPETAETPEKYAAEIKTLEDKGFPVDKTTFESEADKIGQENLATLIEKVTKDESRTLKIRDVIKGNLKSDFSEFQFQIADLQNMESITDEEFTEVSQGIKERTVLAEIKQTLAARPKA